MTRKKRSEMTLEELDESIGKRIKFIKFCDKVIVVCVGFGLLCFLMAYLNKG